jgi:phage gpG-like protein
MSEYLRAHVDLSKVEVGIGKVLGRAEALGQAFRLLERPLRDDQRDHGRSQEGPDGKWPARSPATLGRLRHRSGGKRRVRRARRVLGMLPTTLRVLSSPRRVLAASKVRWAALHQEGGRVGRGAKVPARPFLWVSPEMLDRAVEVLAEHLRSGWR